MRLSRVRLVVREDLLDTFRQRGALRAMVLIPVVLWVVIGVGPILASNTSSTSDAKLRATIAVPTGTPVRLIHAIDHKVRVITRTDPEEALNLSQADAVMDFGRGAAAALDTNTELRVREVLSDRTKGRMALSLAESELQTASLRARGGTPLATRVTSIEVRDPTEARSLLAQALPMLYVVLLGSIVQVAASRFQTGRALRTLEMLLVRPLRRAELLTGIGVAAVTVGLVGAAVVLLPMTALGLLVASGDGAASVAGTAGALVVVVLALCAFFAAVGLAIGVSGKSLQATQARTAMVVLLFTGAALAIEISGVVAKLDWIRWTPFAGALVFIRSTLATGPTVAGLARVLLVTVAACALCFAYARRYLDSERVTTRA